MMVGYFLFYSFDNFFFCYVYGIDGFDETRFFRDILSRFSMRLNILLSFVFLVV